MGRPPRSSCSSRLERPWPRSSRMWMSAPYASSFLTKSPQVKACRFCDHPGTSNSGSPKIGWSSKGVPVLRPSGHEQQRLAEDRLAPRLAERAVAGDLQDPAVARGGVVDLFHVKRLERDGRGRRRRSVEVKVVE